MTELVPASFPNLVAQLHCEPRIQQTLFGLPQQKWYACDPAGPDLGVTLHGRHAGTPVGPAAGPHTQMAQNLLLSYAAGGRFLELKTVQVNDELTIPRPCIDMAGVGYNVEWSQELPIDASAREYAAGAMLIAMFRHSPWGTSAKLDGPAGDVVYEASVGYDLRGIQSAKVSRFLDQMRDAGAIIARLRSEIPSEYAAARDLDFPRELVKSVTLSTFHGCPADEIERICEHLLGEMGFDVSIKFNPPMLGRERLEHVLHDEMGYRDVEVNPAAYAHGLSLDQAVELCRRLTSFAAGRGRAFGVKFCNTLEVLNHRRFFPSDCAAMYLSGQPLYVLAMALADAFSQAFAADLPFSYSGGIDKMNFPDAVACGFVPVTVCTDLLRSGGYGRLPAYLQRLTDAMRQANATSIDAFIRRRGDMDTTAPAARRNLNQIAMQAPADPRYQSAAVCREPKRLNLPLSTFDCISCDKCLSICPNAAIFEYATEPSGSTYRDILVDPSGQWQPAEDEKRHAIKQPSQIAFYADFCNQCGNCDTFCPQQGAPYRDKPGFFGSMDTWRNAAPRDGYVVEFAIAFSRIHARLGGRIYSLELPTGAHAREHAFRDGPVELVIDAQSGEIRRAKLTELLAATYHVDLGMYLALKHLLTGVLDPRSVNPVNVASRRQ